MPKEEWGVKRVCPTTGKRFYDLNRDPIVSPYTGEVVETENGKSSRGLVADKSAEKTKSKETEGDDLVLEDDLEIEESGDSEVDIEDDDVLDDDDDGDTVALDDLADVASDDES